MRMTVTHLASILAAFGVAYAAVGEGIRPHPKATHIIEVRDQTKNDSLPTGNVSIKFSDGHSEIWTTRGRCQLPRISNSGWWVGLMPLLSTLKAGG
jgi:hypothetical protein